MARNRPAAWPQLHVVVETHWAAKASTVGWRMASAFGC
jgi:hypothetical protein